MASSGIELASAWISILPEVKTLRGEVTRELAGVEREAAASGRRSGKAMGGGMSAGMAGIGKRLVAPLAAAAAGMSALDFFSGAVRGASELEQSVGGVDAVFKQHAKTIKASSTGAAQALGLSKNAYNEMATVLGAMLKNQGIKDFTGQTQNLIGVGADLAAQFGGSTKDAVDALAAAMRGESDPIERYGISLNEAAVKAQLAAQGQDKLKGAALEQAKAQARIAIIMRQSADAQGAFAREADTFAGKQARMAASWENFKTAIGGALLPTMSRALDLFVAVGAGVGALFTRLSSGGGSINTVRAGFASIVQSPIGQWFARLAQSVGGVLGPKLREVAAAITGTLWPALRDVGGALLAAGAAFGRFAAAIIGSPVGQFLTTVLKETIVGFVRGVADIFQGLVRVVSGVFQALAGLLTGDWQRMWSGLWQVVAGAVQAIWGLLQAGLMGRVLGVFGGFVRAVGVTFGGLGAFMSGLFRGLVSGFVEFGGTLGRIAGTVIGPVVARVGAAFSGLRGTTTSALDAAGGAFRGFGSAVATVWNTVVSVSTGAWAALFGRAFTPMRSFIAGTLLVAWNAFSSTAAQVWQAVTAWTTQAWATISAVFTAFRTWLVSTIVTALRLYLAAVVAVWTAVRDGITAAWGFLLGRVFTPIRSWLVTTLPTALTAFRNAAGAAWNTVRDAINAAWGFVLGRVFQPMRTWLTTTLVSASNSLRTGAVNAWTTMRDGIYGVWRWIDTRVLTPFKDGLDSLWNWFGVVARGIGATWDTIKGKVAAPVRYVVNNIIRDKLVAAWNSVSSRVGLPSFNFAGMAVGGRVKGWSPNDTADNIPAMLTADEEVIRRRSARKMRRRHPGALEWINRTGTLPGFYAGGRVWDSERPGPRMGGRTSPIRGKAPADQGVWRQMVTWIRRNMPWAAVTSTYRRTMTATGRVSNHARGLAVDIAGPNMMRTFNTLLSTFGRRSIELIHSQAGGRQIYRGQPHFYSGVTRANHFDHVHWSMPSMDPSIPPDFSGGGGFSVPNPVAEMLKKLVNLPVDGAKKLVDGISGLFGSTPWVDVVREGTKKPIDAFGQWLVQKIDARFPPIGGGTSDSAQAPAAAPGSGPVRSQVQAVAARYGWGSGAQWDALQWIIGRESGWNPNAKNPRSTAFGLFQFLSSTWGGTGIARTSNPGLQAEAGMRYIKSRYGTPTGAQGFWQRNGWYSGGGTVEAGNRVPKLFDTGGTLLPGTHLVRNATGKPETIRTWEQEQALRSGANITINGIKYDAVGEFAQALDYALIRQRNIGRYQTLRG